MRPSIDFFPCLHGCGVNEGSRDPCHAREAQRHTQSPCTCREPLDLLGCSDRRRERAPVRVRVQPGHHRQLHSRLILITGAKKSSPRGTRPVKAITLWQRDAQEGGLVSTPEASRKLVRAPRCVPPPPAVDGWPRHERMRAPRHHVRCVQSWFCRGLLPLPGGTQHARPLRPACRTSPKHGGRVSGGWTVLLPPVLANTTSAGYTTNLTAVSEHWTRRGNHASFLLAALHAAHTEAALTSLGRGEYALNMRTN